MLKFVTFYSPNSGRNISDDVGQQMMMLVRSIERVMPDASVHLILPQKIKAPAIQGLSIHRQKKVLSGLMNMKVQSWIDACLLFPDADIVLVDPDILVVGKIDQPFVFPTFDVGLSWHPDTTLPHHINAGVVFIPKSGIDVARAFFQRCLQQISMMDGRYASWYGDQQALVNLVGPAYIARSTCPQDITLEDNTKVRFFNWFVWNRWPKDVSDMSALDDKKARILHFKGPRKPLMAHYFTKQFPELKLD